MVGFAGIIGGAPVLGMAHRLLPAIGVEVDAAAVGLHYGSRRAGGVLDLWVLDSGDAASVEQVTRAGLDATAADLVMRDPDATASFVRHAVEQLPAGSAPAA